VESVNFDRAAGFYDATRALPDGAMADLLGTLTPELATRQPCLEIGVGTGRIALPLRDRGIRMAGADISEAMLRRLVANADGVMPFPLVLADATLLPVATEAFGSVLAVHVLHLIPDWRGAVEEAMRVLRPGGALIASFPGGGTRDGRVGTGASTPWAEVMRETAARHGVVRSPIGARSPGDVADYLEGRALARPLPSVPLTESRTLGRTLRDLEDQLYSWTWPYSRSQVLAAAAEVRAWAAREGVALEDEHVVTGSLHWWAFERAE
jgi:SAM-dependent methyltransferase